jgi:hypothetical protein
MKLSDILEGVAAFPTKERKRAVQMDRLRKRSSYYDEITGQKTDKHPDNNPEFHVVDDDNKAYATFTSYREAEKAIPRLEMKSGKRGLSVRPFP